MREGLGLKDRMLSSSSVRMRGTRDLSTREIRFNYGIRLIVISLRLSSTILPLHTVHVQGQDNHSGTCQLVNRY